MVGGKILKDMTLQEFERKQKDYDVLKQAEKEYNDACECVEIAKDLVNRGSATILQLSNLTCSIFKHSDNSDTAKFLLKKVYDMADYIKNYENEKYNKALADFENEKD